MFPDDWEIPRWNEERVLVRTHNCLGDQTNSVFEFLENAGVFFSNPMDLDFSMLVAYPTAYDAEENTPDEQVTKAVLGKHCHDASQYSEGELKMFTTYHQLFKLGSKPVAHIDALSRLSNKQLLADLPEVFDRLARAVISRLEELPE